MRLKEYISAHLVHATKQSRPITALNFPVTYCTTPDSTHQPTQGNLLWSMNIPTQNVPGVWEETKVLIQNPCCHGVNVQSPGRQHQRSRLSSGCLSCEAAVLLTLQMAACWKAAPETQICSIRLPSTNLMCLLYCNFTLQNVGAENRTAWLVCHKWGLV